MPPEERADASPSPARRAAARVETRPGDVVIGPNWVGGAHCEGTKLRGVQVFYVPAPGFTGTDHFSLDVGYSRGARCAPTSRSRCARGGAAPHRPSWRAASSFMISSAPPPIIITFTSR